jgi:hypothetical protein
VLTRYDLSRLNMEEGNYFWYLLEWVERKKSTLRRMHTWIDSTQLHASRRGKQPL